MLGTNQFVRGIGSRIGVEYAYITPSFPINCKQRLANFMPKKKIENIFGDKEKLHFHQLQLLKWHSTERIEEKQNNVQNNSESENKTTSSMAPDKWLLTKGVQLHDWQKQCIQKWHDANCRGTVKVVTGGGKTILGLAIAERLQNNNTADLRVAIVVPTIVLMNQWYDELIDKGNLPKECIGRMGGGYKESFDGNCCILICVLKSASKKLPRMVEKENLSTKLLLIVDECHRVSANQSSNVLSTRSAYSLGLSATPDSNGTDSNTKYNDSLTGCKLGRVVYELSYVDALKYGLIPPFTIQHYGVSLNQRERNKYIQLTKIIRDASKKLPRPLSGEFLYTNAIKIAKTKSKYSSLAAKYKLNVDKRKELLFHAESRKQAVIKLIKKEISINKNSQIILFHERIELAVQLFISLRSSGFNVAMEHSTLPDSLRSNGLDLFRKGVAQILVSVKSLIEGFNVPAVDVGIIVASSSSPRQRIQSIGRVMRRHHDKDGERQTSCIHVIYAQDTTDELIYEKFDWEKLTGAERNFYYKWTKGEEPVKQSSPPRPFLPGEDDIDSAALKIGASYPGRYEGNEYTCDNNHNVSTLSNQHEDKDKYVYDAGELAKMVIETGGQAGRFIITPKKNFVLVKDRTSGKGTLYAGNWQLKPTLTNKQENFDILDKQKCRRWVKNAKPGDEYPISHPQLETEKWRYKQGTGGQIVKKVYRGDSRAKMSAGTENLLREIKELIRRGKKITLLERTPDHHILFRQDGKLWFIIALNNELEFPK